MKYGVFMHIFNDISVNAYVFQEYFFNYEFYTILWNILKYVTLFMWQ